MRVLVTGGCGMIGFHIAKFYAQQNYDVDVIDNLERSDLLGHDVSDVRRNYNMERLRGMKVNVYPFDVTLKETWKAIARFPAYDAIFHMAAQCGVPTSVLNPNRDFEVNTVGTFHALERARTDNARFVYASTNKVYPLHEGWKLNKDTDRWRWKEKEWNEYGFPVALRVMTGARTPYGTSKYLGDLLCQEYYHTYGVPTGIFRMSCIYGDHQFGFEEQGWATWFAIATLKREPIRIYGDGRQVRDMLWVGDLVRAYDKFAFHTDLQHGIWNMGGGPEYSISLRECIDILKRLTGKQSELNFHDWRPADQRIYTSDIRPVKQDLQWFPRIDPEAGLRRIVSWAEPMLDVF